MRTLVITPMLPAQSESDRGGKHRRMAIFLRALSRLSRSLEILSIVPEEIIRLSKHQADLDRSQSRFWGVDISVSLLPRSRRQENAFNHYAYGIFRSSAQPMLYPYASARLAEQIGLRLDEGFDCVFVDRLDAMVPVLGSGRLPRTVLFDMDDLYHKVLIRKLRHDPWRPGKIPLALHLPALINLERRAVSRSTLSFVCSGTDQATLRRLGFRGNIGVVPNSITPPADPPGLTVPPTVLFLGSYHHVPNRIAVNRLTQHIWPGVRRKVADARLMIAGAGSDTLPSYRADCPGVEYLGFVEDLDTLYAQSRVICTPIVQGSGTRLKLVEAAAYARPIISTPMGAEGLSFRDGVDALLRESDAEIIQACVRLLRDDALCIRLGNAARQTVLAAFDARVVERQIGELVRNVTAS